MPVLRMIRREKYAQARAMGCTQKEALKEAGYEWDRTDARLEANPAVRARIDELMEAHGETRRIAETKAVEDAAFSDAMGKAEVLQGLRTVFELAIAQMPIVSSCTDKETGEVSREVVGLGSPENLAAANRALELMGKQEGMFAEHRHIHTDPGVNMDRDQLLLAISRIDERLQAIGAPALPSPKIIDHEPVPA